MNTIRCITWTRAKGRFQKIKASGKKTFPGFIIPPTILPRGNWRKVDILPGVVLYPGERLKLPSGKTIFAPVEEIVLTPQRTQYQDLDLIKLEELRLPTYRAFMLRLGKLFGEIAKGSKILVLASGYSPELGALTPEQQKNTFCIDINPKFLQVARGFHPQASFTEGDIASLPFKAKSFDYVLALNAFGFLPRKQIKPILKEIYRVTKKRGVVTELSDTCPNASWFGKGSPIIKQKLQKGVPLLDSKEKEEKLTLFTEIELEDKYYKRIVKNYYAYLVRNFEDIGFSSIKLGGFESKYRLPSTSLHKKHRGSNIFTSELSFCSEAKDKTLGEEVLEWVIFRGLRAVKAEVKKKNH